MKSAVIKPIVGKMMNHVTNPSRFSFPNEKPSKEDASPWLLAVFTCTDASLPTIDTGRLPATLRRVFTFLGSSPRPLRMRHLSQSAIPNSRTENVHFGSKLFGERNGGSASAVAASVNGPDSAVCERVVGVKADASGQRLEIIN